MNVFSWNCRGSEGAATIPTLQLYLWCTGAKLAFISKTNCLKDIAEGKIGRLLLQNATIIPSKGRGGGLWLLWSDEISVSILESLCFLIVTKIKKYSLSEPWILLCVYGDNTDKANQYVWERMVHYIQNSGYSVCSFGYFNAIGDISEKMGK